LPVSSPLHNAGTGNEEENVEKPEQPLQKSGADREFDQEMWREEYAIDQAIRRRPVLWTRGHGSADSTWD
jgi:hypothetical protein